MENPEITQLKLKIDTAKIMLAGLMPNSRSDNMPLLDAISLLLDELLNTTQAFTNLNTQANALHAEVLRLRMENAELANRLKFFRSKEDI